MKKPDPSYAPLYCAMYPDLAKLVKGHGYALAVHGSLQRDFDLICIPWTDNPSETKVVVNEIEQEFAVKQVGEPDIALHKRERYTLSIGYGECFMDLSFMPSTN
ncbi:hypothetical protein ACXITX_22810 [Vibrio parahaemolyticus]